jgi:pyruvate dehydrogenase E1 component alpha subunit
MDIHAVRKGLTEAVERARSGGGPTLIEAKTYRFSGHSRADQALYRPEGELEKWLKRDPILVTEQDLLKREVITESQIESMKEEMTSHIAGVVEKATADPNPDISAMFNNIYAQKKGN